MWGFRCVDRCVPQARYVRRLTRFTTRVYCRSVVGGGSEGLLGRRIGTSRAMCAARCEKCSEKLHSYPAYPACSVEPLEIWLTHVQRAFREKAVSHFRPDCQPRGRGGVSCCVARPLIEPLQRPPLAWRETWPSASPCAFAGGSAPPSPHPLGPRRPCWLPRALSPLARPFSRPRTHAP